jgi:hypothetical protein
MELLLLGLLSKFLTDVIKWLASQVKLAIPDMGKKIAAFILSLAAAYIARLHLPGTLGDELTKSLGTLQTPLAGILVAGLSYALHDLLDWLARVAGNLQPKTTPAQAR